MRFSLLLAVCAATLLAAGPASAQTALWTDVSASSLGPSDLPTLPTAYRTVQLDRSQMATRLASAPDRDLARGITLSIPLPEGGFVDVRVAEASIMAPALQARYPEIRTYLADGPGTIHGRLSLTPAGFAGMLFTPEGTLYVDPYGRGSEAYVVYRGQDLVVDAALRGATADVVREVPGIDPGTPGLQATHGDVLRTYRLAVAATGEYTAFHGGTVAAGQAAIVTAMNRVTGIYERDFSVTFTLVPNNDSVVYTNGTTDPYTNNNGFTMLGQNQANLDLVIGSANYDIGHVFSTGGGGVAGLGVVCSTGNKARGVTGLNSPIGDGFYVDYVAHEMGHQFRGNHTFNGNANACSGGNRNGSTAYEPGSGTTIMAYAGICGSQNTQNNSDDIFHVASLNEVTAFITTGGGSTCGTASPTGNPVPSASAPSGFTIPVGTPFTLTGSATDDDPGQLTYIWEEYDLGPAGAPGSATPPYFRSFTPTAEPTRTFPQFDRLLAGLPPVIGEAYPQGTRTLTFKMTVRDNEPGGGAIDDATVTLNTNGSTGPFVVTFASTSGESYPSGPTTVTWTPAGTAAFAPNVEIMLSTDGGATFSSLLASTPNDGSQDVTLPAIATTNARILIRAVGNVFFNVNPQPFEIVPTTGGGVSILIDDPRGFRFLGTPSPGLTVDDLADMNLVRGVPGYYPGANPPNLETTFDTAAGAWIPSSGTGEVLELGKAFRWRFYDHSNGNPTISQSVPLPMTLSTELPPNTSDVTLELQTGGARMNYLANPFGTDLDLTDILNWPGGDNVSPNAPVWVYDPISRSFVTAPASIPAWMGFRVRAKGPTAGGNPRLLTIPASAALTGGARPSVRAAVREVQPGLSFTLSGVDGDGLAVVDRGFAMVFSEEARAAYDADEDVAKFQVPAESYALIGSRAGDAFVGYDVRPFAAGEIPLAIEARGTESRFTLRWDAEALPAGLPVVLVDLVTGREIDVRMASSYAFDVSRTLAAFDEVIPSSDFADGASATDRFVLRIGTPASAEAAVTAVSLTSIAPNPSSGSARVSFAVPEAGAVRLTVVDVRGRAVATLVDGPLSAGRHEARMASDLAAGVYVVRLEAAGTVVTRQAVIVR